MRGKVVAPAQMLLGVFPPGMTLNEGHPVVDAGYSVRRRLRSRRPGCLRCIGRSAWNHKPVA